MAFFLHYAAHSDFEQGIFTPYATQEEAERQAAYDLANGTDPDFIEQIFEAPYELPKFGWTRATVDQNHQNDLLPHLDEKRRTRAATAKQIQQRASKHQQTLLDEGLKAQADYLVALDKAIKDGSAFKAAVPGNAYSVMTGGTATAGAAALAAATAKTLVMITASTANQPAVIEIGISFDGVTASAVPVLVELVSGTATTTGTVVAQTPKQLRGWPSQGSQTTGQITITAEPTVQLVNRKWNVTPNGGLFALQFPLGREPTGIVTATTDAKTWSIRATSPAIVNAHAYLEFEE
jgi:hypothetical protein